MNYTAVFLILFISSFSLIFHLYKYSTNTKSIKKKEIPNPPTYFKAFVIDKPPVLHIFNNNTLMIYRAIQDIRFNNIKILCGIYENYTDLLIVKVNNQQINYSIEYLGLLILYNVDFPLKYANIIIPVIQNIQSFTVNGIEIEYTAINKIDYKYDFTVCINSLKNNFTAKTIVDQVLSIYRKEGVSHAIIYYGDISKEVYDVLDKHVKSGFLEIFYWPQLEILSYIRNYGQILKMNDCLYRSYYNSKYIINSDIDEIIMPKKFKTLPRLIHYYERILPKCELFYFMNKIFPITNEIDYTEKQYRNSYKNLTPVVDINIFDYRIACNAIFESHKYIVKTKKVASLRIHEVVGLEEKNQKCTVKEKHGYSRHTRNLLEYHQSRCVKKETDNTILNYS